MIYLKTFASFSGEPVQINIRVPEGLNEKMMTITKKKYGFSKKADYVRTSIACLLSVNNEVNEILLDTEKFIAEQESKMNSVYESLIEGLIDRKDGKDIILETLSKLRND